MPIGKRIYLKREIIVPELLKEFRNIPTSNIADVMDRSCAMNPRIRLMSSPKAKITAGFALTIKTCAGDNLLIHAALNMAKEEDILVVSNEGGSNRSLIGEVMISYLSNTKKAEGIVIDGPIRDIDEIAKLDFPVYATGTTPGGPYKNGPGEINIPVACGNIAVFPGDIIVTDPDGVIVIPQKDAEDILQEAKKFMDLDKNKIAAAKNGTIKRDWVEKSLVEKGFEFIDDVYSY